MFECLNEKHQVSIKKIVSRWLREFIIEPTLQRREPEAYLKGFKRKKAAESCYEYLELTEELSNSFLLVDKKQLVKDMAMYIDLRIPFIYSRNHLGTPEYRLDSKLFEKKPLHYKENNLRAISIIKEAQKSMVLNNRVKWSNEKPSLSQIKLIEKTLSINKKKQQLRMKIEDIDKYQAAILIPYLLEKQVYDQEGLQRILE